MTRGALVLVSFALLLIPRASAGDASTAAGRSSPAAKSAPARRAAAGKRGASDDWTLLWSDEFNGPKGSLPDPSKWAFDAGGGGWGNGESEFYCAPGSGPPCDAAKPNAYQDGAGRLVLEAVRLSTESWPSSSSETWTSARIRTQGLADFGEGRIESRIRLPVGAGLWPAFWMLGDTAAPWPDRGEIDIMENVPSTARRGPLGPGKVRSTVHGPGYSGDDGIGRDAALPKDGRVDDGFHVYGVIRSPRKLAFYVDDWRHPFFVMTPDALPAGAAWKLDGYFYVILNLAVGGGQPGPPDTATPSPARMLVDWVRAYRPAEARLRP